MQGNLFQPTIDVAINGFIIIIVVIFIGAILKIFLTKKGVNLKPTINKEISYKKRKALFTKTEIKFLTILEEQIIVNPDLKVFGQVRMIDVIEPNYKLKNWRSAKAKVIQKHFDYVVVNKNDYSIVCAIELNDNSHNKPQRQKRDEFVREACKNANLPLIEIRAAMKYDVDVVMTQMPVAMLEIFLDDKKTQNS